MAAVKHFWEHIPLQEMTQAQWESLCDGCGKCCLHKLQDEFTGVVYYTDIACQYLNRQCGCDVYDNRAKKVSDCITLRPEDVESFFWLPASCSYRLVYEGKSLPRWHHLISGDRQAVHAENASVSGKVKSELSIAEEDYEDHIIRWID